MPPTRPNDDDWDSLKENFPGLTKDAVWITDNTVGVYNCLAWALGVSDEEIDPGNVADTKALFTARGYTELAVAAADADVDLMGFHASYVRHAQKRYSGARVEGMPGNLWESKLSNDIRVTHLRTDLVEAQDADRETFGAILCSLKKPAPQESDEGKGKRIVLRGG